MTSWSRRRAISPTGGRLRVVEDDSVVLASVVDQAVQSGQAIRLTCSATGIRLAIGPLALKAAGWALVGALSAMSMGLVVYGLLVVLEKIPAPGSGRRPRHAQETGPRLTLQSGTAGPGSVDLTSVKSATFSPDTRYLMCTSDSGALIVWDLATGRKLRFLDGDTPVDGAVFTPDGRNLVTSHGNTIRLLDADTGQQIGVFRADEDGVVVQSLSVNPDGSQVLASYSDGSVRVWDTSTGEVISLFRVTHETEASPAASPDDMVFAADGTFALTVPPLPDMAVRVWDTTTGEVIRTFVQGARQAISAMGVSPNGRSALSGTSDGQIHLWDVDTGQERATIRAHAAQVTSTAFSRNSRYAVTGSLDSLVKMWDLAKGKVVRTFRGHAGGVTSVGFSPDGRFVLSGSVDETARLWDVKSGAQRLTWTYMKNGDWAAITPEGHFDGTPAGIRALNVEHQGQSLPLESLYEAYYTPNLAARLMSEQLLQTSGDIRAGLAPPPSVSIHSPESGTSFGHPVIEVTIAVADRGGGAEDARLYHNGKLVATTTRGLKRKSRSSAEETLTLSVRLLPGENRLQASAFSRQRTETRSEEIRVQLEEASASSKLLILAVGIDKYRNPRYRLNYARKDAQSFAAALMKAGEGIFAEIETRTLFDLEANRTALIKALKEIGDRAQPEDVFVLFYAGHGVVHDDSLASGQYFLALTDVTQLYSDTDALLRAEGFSAAELQEACTAIAARKQLLILDACQSGAAVESFALRGAAEEKAIRQLQRSAGVALIVSSGAEQFATEVDILGHGAFTHALLQALRGDADGSPRDGKVTTAELGAFVEDLVPEICLQNHLQPQYPNSYTRGQDFPVGLSVAQKLGN